MKIKKKKIMKKIMKIKIMKLENMRGGGVGPKGPDTSAEGTSGLEAEGREVTSPKGEWPPAGARIKSRGAAFYSS